MLVNSSFVDFSNSSFFYLPIYSSILKNPKVLSSFFKFEQFKVKNQLTNSQIIQIYQDRSEFKLLRVVKLLKECGREKSIIIFDEKASILHVDGPMKCLM